MRDIPQCRPAGDPTHPAIPIRNLGSEFADMVQTPSLPAAELPIADMNIIDQAPNQLVEPMIVNYVPLPEYELLTEPFDIDNLAVPSELYQKGKCQFNTFNLN